MKRTCGNRNDNVKNNQKKKEKFKKKFIYQETKRNYTNPTEIPSMAGTLLCESEKLWDNGHTISKKYGEEEDKQQHVTSGRYGKKGKCQRTS